MAFANPLKHLLCRPGTREILGRIERRLERMEKHMATQTDVDNLVGRINSVKSAVDTGVAGIRSDLEALKAEHPELDLSALTASVASLETSVQGVTELDAENPAAPVEPAEPEVPVNPEF